MVMNSGLPNNHDAARSSRLLAVLDLCLFVGLPSLGSISALPRLTMNKEIRLQAPNRVGSALERFLLRLLASSKCRAIVLSKSSRRFWLSPHHDQPGAIFFPGDGVCHGPISFVSLRFSGSRRPKAAVFFSRHRFYFHYCLPAPHRGG